MTAPEFSTSPRRELDGDGSQHSPFRRRFCRPVSFLSLSSSSSSEISLDASAASDPDNSLEMVPDDGPESEGAQPIAFVDLATSSFIDCYADCVATIGGIRFTIGIPCDNAVALCYFDSNGNLSPVELDSDLMNQVFPICASILEEEFGDELVLQQTPQTLTLVGELEQDDDDDDDDKKNDNDDKDPQDDEEEVEVLLSFEHEEQTFSLVRLLDPVLLVGKNDAENALRRILLTPSESDRVMPLLEDLFLQAQQQDEELFGKGP